LVSVSMCYRRRKVIEPGEKSEESYQVQAFHIQLLSVDLCFDG
jgi:hypothetical protein